MHVPVAPFRSVPLLLLDPPDSEFLTFLLEAHRLVERNPKLLTSIDADLDRHGLKKKALRRQDARWRAARNPRLPTVDHVPVVIDSETQRLGAGRERTSAYVVYMFLAGRGYFGGFKSSTATTLVLESITLHVFLTNHGTKLPGRSTLTDLVNAVSKATHQQILDAQIRAVLDEGWDDFDLFLQDSTSVEANTLWPTESRLMVDLVARLHRRGGRLESVGLPCFVASCVPKVLGKMSALDRQINLETPRHERARVRRRLYEKLLVKARKAATLLTLAVDATRAALLTLDVLPSVGIRAVRVVMWLDTDLANLRTVIANCEARVLRGEKVAAKDKVLSVSDPDAAFIVKGERDPVVGYKPQLARSRQGFITGLIVPRGNAADSGQLVPMFDAVVARTGVVPSTASVDDGYSSRTGRAVLQARGVNVVSISGSKGKHITPPEDWDREDYSVARDDRSAIESLMFTIKDGYDFGRVARRGLAAVEAELMEKVIAYNFCRMAHCRQAARDQAHAA